MLNGSLHSLEKMSLLPAMIYPVLSCPFIPHARRMYGKCNRAIRIQCSRFVTVRNRSCLHVTKIKVRTLKSSQKKIAWRFFANLPNNPELMDQGRQHDSVFMTISCPETKVSMQGRREAKLKPATISLMEHRKPKMKGMTAFPLLAIFCKSHQNHTVFSPGT